MSSQAKFDSQPQPHEETTNQQQQKQHQSKLNEVAADTKAVHPQPPLDDDHGLRLDDGKHHHNQHEVVDCIEYDDGSGDVTGKCFGMTQQAHHFRCVG